MNRSVLVRSRLLALALSCATFTVFPHDARAHYLARHPTIGELILSADLVVRGTITRGTYREGGYRLAGLHVDKVLKGHLDAGQITFASDPDHGVTYSRGERVVVFLTRTAVDRLPSSFARPVYFSPQEFGAKFRITSFDPTGYDGLVSGLAAAARIPDLSLRRAKVIEVLTAQLRSHERKVRQYAGRVIAALSAQPVSLSRDHAEDRARRIVPGGDRRKDLLTSQNVKTPVEAEREHSAACAGAMIGLSPSCRARNFPRGSGGAKGRDDR